MNLVYESGCGLWMNFWRILRFFFFGRLLFFLWLLFFRLLFFCFVFVLFVLLLVLLFLFFGLFVVCFNFRKLWIDASQCLEFQWSSVHFPFKFKLFIEPFFFGGIHKLFKLHLDRTNYFSIIIDCYFAILNGIGDIESEIFIKPGRWGLFGVFRFFCCKNFLAYHNLHPAIHATKCTCFSSNGGHLKSEAEGFGRFFSKLCYHVDKTWHCHFISDKASELFFRLF